MDNNSSLFPADTASYLSETGLITQVSRALYKVYLEWKNSEETHKEIFPATTFFRSLIKEYDDALKTLEDELASERAINTELLGQIKLLESGEGEVKEDNN